MNFTTLFSHGALIFASIFPTATMDPAKKQQILSSITTVALIFTALLVITVAVGLLIIRKNKKK